MNARNKKNVALLYSSPSEVYTKCLHTRGTADLNLWAVKSVFGIVICSFHAHTLSFMNFSGRKLGKCCFWKESSFVAAIWEVPVNKHHCVELRERNEKKTCSFQLLRQ